MSRSHLESLQGGCSRLLDIEQILYDRFVRCIMIYENMQTKFTSDMSFQTYFLAAKAINECFANFDDRF